MPRTSSRFFCLAMNIVIMTLVFCFHSSLLWAFVCAFFCVMIADKTDCLIQTKYQSCKGPALAIGGFFLSISILLGNHGIRHFLSTFLIFILLYMLTCRRCDCDKK